MSLQFALAIFIGLAASAEDIWRRNISNWIPVAALVAGFGWHLYAQGWRGLGAAALGAIGGFAIFLLFYLLGGMGGGDVKLMAGFGAIIGTSRLLEASLWTAILGALLAVAVLAVAFLRQQISGNKFERPKAIPYAPAITAGVWLSLVPR